MNIDTFNHQGYWFRRRQILVEYFSALFKNYSFFIPDIEEIYQNTKEFLNSGGPFIKQLEQEAPNVLRNMTAFIYSYPKFENKYLNQHINKKDLYYWFNKITSQPEEIVGTLLGGNTKNPLYKELRTQVYIITDRENEDYKYAVKRIIALQEDNTI